jgi:predicted nucleic acid-binding Zn ribbon protein
MKNKCPVCGYGMPFPPEDNNICSSCGTEFGYDDARKTYAQIRQEWITGGAKWFSSYATRPLGWNPWMQLIQAGHDWNVPFHVELHTRKAAVVYGEANLQPAGLRVQFI